MALLLLLLSQPPMGEPTKYDIAHETLRIEVARFHTRIRGDERRIAQELDPAKRQEMRRELDSYKRDVNAMLIEIWNAVERLRLREPPRGRLKYELL